MKIFILGSGSKGNSTFIDLGNKKILIDVGFSYKHIKEELNKINVDPKEIDAVLITHDHVDHVYGLKVFINKVKPYLYITPEIEELILKENYEKSIYLGEELHLDNTLIKVIPTSHDALTSNGFLLEKNNISLVYITDTGYINHRYFETLKNKTYYIIESNHDTEKLIKGKYPEYLQRRILSDKGHLSNELCGGYLSKFIGPNTKKVVLAHLSQENNTEELALNTNLEILKENNLKFTNIVCAREDELTEVTND